MNKNFRAVEALVELINEYVEIENSIAALPCGYISVKQISGHTYNYRQWREGSKIVSEYVPVTLLPGMKRKIAMRKEHEALLKAVKMDLKKATRQVVKAGLLSEEDVEDLLNAGKAGQDITALTEAKLAK